MHPSPQHDHRLAESGAPLRKGGEGSEASEMGRREAGAEEGEEEGETD